MEEQNRSFILQNYSKEKSELGPSSCCYCYDHNAENIISTLLSSAASETMRLIHTSRCPYTTPSMTLTCPLIYSCITKYFQIIFKSINVYRF
jgi:hypothetical protein